jgi:hypothetical protein
VRPREASVLRVLLVGFIAVGLLLGAFAFAGDRLGLWEPIEVPRSPGQAHEKGTGPNGLVETDTRLPEDDQPRPPPSPPLPAETAFLSAMFAAAMGLLALAARRVVRVVSDVRGACPRPARWFAARRATDALSRLLAIRRRAYTRSTSVVHRLGVLAMALARMPRRAAAPAIAVATKARSSSFHLRISHPAREDLTFYVIAIVLCVALGYLVAVAVQ